jgi:hypothetical protein
MASDHGTEHLDISICEGRSSTNENIEKNCLCKPIRTQHAVNIKTY